MAGLRRSVGLYLAAAACNALIPFFTLPALARWLGPAEFGRAGAFLALVNVAVVLVGLSTHGQISVIYFRDGAGRLGEAVAAAVRVMLLTSVPFAIGLAGLAHWRPDLIGVPAAWGVAVVVAAAAQFIVAVGMAVAQAREMAARYAMLQIGLSFSWSAIALGLAGGFDMGWQSRAIGQVLGAVLMAGVTLVWFNRLGIGWRGPVDRTVLTAALRFGISLAPHSIAAALMASVDRLILKARLGAEATGYYFAAFQIAAVITVAAAAVNQAWVPWLYRVLAGSSPGERQRAVRLTYLLFLAGIAGTLLLIWLAPTLVAVMAGPAYAPAVPLLRLLAPAAMFSGMYFFVTNYLFYTERTAWLSAATVGVAGFALALIVGLVDRQGVRGAALAVLVAQAGYFLLVWRLAQAACPMPWFRPFARGAA